MTIQRDYQFELLQTMKDLANFNKWWSSPLNLGGVAGPSGGSGTPVGGIFGELIQTKVAYDVDESAWNDIQTLPPSGTLLDNMAHIRYRLGVLETVSGASSAIDIYDSGAFQGTVTSIDFVDNMSATVSGSSAYVNSTASGGGGFVADLSLWLPDASPFIPASGYTAVDDEFSDNSLDTGIWTVFDVATILTTNEEESGLVLTPSISTVGKIAGILQDHDNSNISIYTYVSNLSRQDNDLKAGIILGYDLDSNPSTGDIVTFNLYNGGAGTGLQSDYYTDYQTADTGYLNETSGLWLTGIYLRIRYDAAGPTIYADFSSDGTGWSNKLIQVSPLTGINQIGLFIKSGITDWQPKSVFKFFRIGSDIGESAIMSGDRISQVRGV